MRWTETPAPWVGAVCDKGIRHARNEDALATAATASATEPGAYAVLVVCDGVTSAPDSDQASLAAATEACDHLVGAARAAVRHGGAPVTNAAAVEASVRALSAAGRVAQVAVLGVTERLAQAAPGGVLSEPPSCTFVAAVLTGRRLAVGWCGDSRAYWLGDDGDERQLSTDHSLASELIAGGMSRVEAEQDPTAHTITRWLGADSANSSPDTVTLDWAYYNPVSLVLKQEGWLEDELKADGITVRWVQSAGSNKALEFLNAGSLDFGSTAGAAALLGRINGNPIRTVWVYSKPE